MKSVFDVLGTRGLVALRPAKLLQNFVSALLTHIYYMKSSKRADVGRPIEAVSRGWGWGWFIN